MVALETHALLLIKISNLFWWKTMSFRILINENLKNRSIRDLYDFINKFQSVDWGLFYYGFGIEGRDLERFPKCGSIPTNYGSIIFPDFSYDTNQFIDRAEGLLPKGIVEDLKKVLEEDEFIVIRDELDRDMIKKVVTKYPNVIDSVDIELILPVIVNVDVFPNNLEDAFFLYEKESKRMKEIADFCKEIPPPFYDVEVHQWDCHYAEPETVEKAIKNLDEKELSTDYLLDGIIAELDEELEEKGYILLLRTNQNVKLKLKELEMRLDEALSQIKPCISMKTCFVTLVL